LPRLIARYLVYISERPFYIVFRAAFEANSMRYVSYTRVSTEEQGKSGLGLDAQAERIARFVAEQGGTVIKSFEEVRSGADNDRPQLRAAIAYAKKMRRKGEPVFVCVSKLDRLSRSSAFIGAMMEKDAPFVVADLGHDVDPFMLHIYAALAEKERAMIGHRTRDALQALKTQGKVLGHANITTVRVLGEAVRVANAQQRKANIRPIIESIQASGITTLKGIAAELTARRVPTPRGGEEWQATQVSRVLA